jgi:ubiquinol-cytochrome c reductase cytochrome b subunit
MYIIHVLLIPGLLLALITAHLFLMFHQKHTQMPGKGRTDRNVVGQPLYPYFMAKTGAFFFFTFGVLALLGCLAQINPIWLYGPYNPVAMSAGSQPDFYMGMLEGALRIFPNWAWNIAGHTISWNVLIPALVPLGLLFTAAALWPFLERWITGDQREHHVNDRPRNAATRTAIGIAVITWYGIMWLEGANDVIAQHLSISLYTTTEIARYAVVIGPVVAYIATKRICLGLQRKDAQMLLHGYETGIIYQRPDGEFIELHAPVPEEKRAELEARSGSPLPLEAGEDDGSGVPAPATRGAVGKLRLALNRVVTESVPLPVGNGHGTNGHGTNGHGANGHGEPERTAVTSGEGGKALPGPDSPEDPGSH